MGGVGEKIMVGALTGVMSPLLGKLTGIMGEEYAKVKGARKKLESLTKELIAINVMLEKYATMERPDVQVKAWIKAVRDLAYDMEDRVDLFTYYVDHEPAAGKATGFKGFLRRNARRVKRLRNRYRFAGEIQELQALVDEAYERRLKYKLDESTGSAVHTEIDPRLPALYVEMEKLVGMEGPIEEILDRFVGEDPGKQLRVVSIVGSGGSGKTTLAQQVYRRIEHHFSNTVSSRKEEEKKPYMAFVSVSQRPNISNILRTLLSETERTDGIPEQMGSFSDKQLIDRLRKYLQDRR
jgi:disease resistance protein RPM1